MSVSEADKASTLAWLKEFHQAGDALNPEPWIKAFWTPDAVQYFASNTPLKGRDAILETMTRQCAVLASMKHTLGRVDVLPDRIYQEVTITYTVKNDPEMEEIVVRGFAIYHKGLKETQMWQFDVFGDFSKLGDKITKCAS